MSYGTRHDKCMLWYGVMEWDGMGRNGMEWEPARRTERRTVSSFLFGRCGCFLWRVFTKRWGTWVLTLQKIKRGGRWWLKTKQRGGGWCPATQGHHSSDIPSITLKKQNGVLTSRWRGAKGRADGGVGGGLELGNQMWSIKTYWHAKGLLLPHSHTRSTNSHSSPRCMCGRMHMSPWLYKPRNHVHTWVHWETYNVRSLGQKMYFSLEQKVTFMCLDFDDCWYKDM